MPGLELPRMLVLSIIHITTETNYVLDAKCHRRDTLAAEERMSIPQVYAKGKYGYILPLLDDDDCRERYALYPDLKSIRALATSVGASWIMLDRDADIVAGLPTYEW